MGPYPDHAEARPKTGVTVFVVFLTALASFVGGIVGDRVYGPRSTYTHYLTEKTRIVAGDRVLLTLHPATEVERVVEKWVIEVSPSGTQVKVSDGPEADHWSRWTDATDVVEVLYPRSRE